MNSKEEYKNLRKKLAEVLKEWNTEKRQEKIEEFNELADILEAKRLSNRTGF